MSFSSYFQAARGAETGSDMPQYKLECVNVCVHSSLSTRVCLLCGEGSRREVDNSFGKLKLTAAASVFSRTMRSSHSPPPVN